MFETKDVLIRETLDSLNARLLSILVRFEDQPLMTPGTLIGALSARSRQSDIAPFLRLWTEIVSAGAQGETPFDNVAQAMVSEWVLWIEQRFHPGWRGTGMAETILAILDGMILLDLARPGTMDAARTLLPNMLDGHAEGGHGPS